MAINFNSINIKLLDVPITTYPWSYFPGEAMDSQVNGEMIYELFLDLVKVEKKQIRSLRDTHQISCFKHPIRLSYAMLNFFYEQINFFQSYQVIKNEELNAAWADFKKGHADLLQERDEGRSGTAVVSSLKNAIEKIFKIMQGNEGVHPEMELIISIFLKLVEIPYFDTISMPTLFDKRCNDGALNKPGASFDVFYTAESIVQAVHDFCFLIINDWKWIASLQNYHESDIKLIEGFLNDLVLEVLDIELFDLKSIEKIEELTDSFLFFDEDLLDLDLIEFNTSDYLFDFFIKNRVYAVEALLSSLYSSYKSIGILISCADDKLIKLDNGKKIVSNRKNKKKKKKKKEIKEIAPKPVLSCEKKSRSRKENLDLGIARAPSFKGGTASFLAAQAREHFEQGVEGVLMRHIVWSLDHLAVLQDKFSSNFGPEHNLTLFAGLVGISSRVLELVYRHLSKAPFEGHDLKKIFKEYQPVKAAPQIVDKLVWGSDWSRFFFIENAVPNNPKSGTILKELVKTANSPNRVPQEDFKRMFVDLHQKVIAEVEEKLSLQAPPVGIEPVFEPSSFTGCEELIGIVNQLQGHTGELLKKLKNPQLLHVKQSKAAWEMLASSVKQIKEAKDDKTFAFFIVQALAQLQGGTEQLLHALEHIVLGSSTKIHEIAILAKSLDIDSSSVESVFENLSNKTRYPAEHLQESFGASIIDRTELLAQGYGRGFDFVGTTPKILWKLPADYVNFDKQVLINQLIEAVEKGAAFLQGHVFPRFQ